MMAARWNRGLRLFLPSPFVCHGNHNRRTENTEVNSPKVRRTAAASGYAHSSRWTNFLVAGAQHCPARHINIFRLARDGGLASVLVNCLSPASAGIESASYRGFWFYPIY